MTDTHDAVLANLRAHGYVADDEIATALYLADELGKPLLIEGEAGVGKTEIARVLARIKDTRLVRLQCYEGLDFNSALYEWIYQKQILSLRLHEVRDRAALSLADFYTEDYLSYRPLSQALLAEQPVVLLLDEIDRADEEFEALLLETLAEYQLSIPELGTLTARSRPTILLTSNRTRELSDALRRRCLYLWLDYPGYDKELAVIRLKVPEVSQSLAAQAASLVQALRGQQLNKMPGLSEAIDWTRALLSLKVSALDRRALETTIGCLLKDHQDIVRFKRDLMLPLLEKVAGEHGV